MGFATSEGQRQHYKTEWHRYNLKRKIAGMVPVSADNFRERVAAQQEKEAKESTSARKKRDTSSNQATGTEPALPSLISSSSTSRSHMPATAAAATAATATATPSSSSLPSAAHAAPSLPLSAAASATPMELGALPTPPSMLPPSASSDAPLSQSQQQQEQQEQQQQQQQQQPRSKPAPPPPTPALEVCIFCPRSSLSFEENLKHMTEAHSFFVPDLEYIEDLEGLVTFLQTKVFEQHLCLYCNGKGRGFGGVEAARKHMLDKGHCMIDYSEQGADEISEFYDFSASYPDWEDVESGEEDVELTAEDLAGAAFNEATLELVLPSGARCGHRSLRRYYRQRFRQEDTRDSVLTQQLYNSRKAIGNGTKSAVLPPRERRERDRFIVRSQYMRQAISLKQNALQFHFRRQVDV